MTTRERRIGATSIDMSMEHLLEFYFNTKPELSMRKSELIEKTIALTHEEIFSESENN